MIDQQSVERAAERFQLPEGSFERLELRRDRKQRNRRIRAGVLGIAIAVVVGWWGIHAITSTAPKPAHPSEKFGIFAPVAGRIVFQDDQRGVLAVDPNGPVDTQEGEGIAPDVASTLVPLELDAEPIDWSPDGTELLFTRSTGGLIVATDLYVLHADGTETKLTGDQVGFDNSAAFTPDGRVVFTGSDGLEVVDPDGGHLETVGTLPGAAWGVAWSSDGTRIAYVTGNRHFQVWIANADGTGAQQILADQPFGYPAGLSWSPTGDRLALGADRYGHGDGGIYTFAPDGSDFTRVTANGREPVWSPDGLQLAYTILCEDDPTFTTCVQYQQPGTDQPGLVIADADGSNAKVFGYATAGPWHPGTSTQTPAS